MPRGDSRKLDHLCVHLQSQVSFPPSRFVPSAFFPVPWERQIIYQHQPLIRFHHGAHRHRRSHKNNHQNNKPGPRTDRDNPQLSPPASQHPPRNVIVFPSAGNPGASNGVQRDPGVGAMANVQHVFPPIFPPVPVLASPTALAPAVFSGTFVEG
jgi:hypothetical protein